MSQAASMLGHALDREQRPEDLVLQHGGAGGQVGGQRGRHEPPPLRDRRPGCAAGAPRAPRAPGSRARASARPARSAAGPASRSRRPGRPGAARRPRACARSARRRSPRARARARPPSTSARRRRTPRSRSRGSRRRGRRPRPRSRSSCRPSRTTTRFTCRWPGGVRAAVLDDLEADRPRAREGDRRDTRMPDERGAHVALAGQELDGRGRHAALAQRLDAGEPGCRRLLGGLQDHGVAGRERAGHHARRDREREVPGRDHRAHAARP